MMHSSLLERYYPESRFGGFSDLDGTVIFYGRVHAIINENTTVLDVGCGRGAGSFIDPIPYRRGLRNLRGHCRKVIGIDVDPSASENPGLDEFHLISGPNWPIADGSIGVIISDWVLEHLEIPELFFSEVQRVLEPGGIFCARTSNRIGYVGLFSRLLPNRWHDKILKRVASDRQECDVFPTYHRVNTAQMLRHVMKKAGLDGIAYGYEAEPSYLRFSSLAYVFGKYLHAFTPSLFRTCLFVFARKPL